MAVLDDVQFDDLVFVDVRANDKTMPDNKIFSTATSLQKYTRKMKMIEQAKSFAKAHSPPLALVSSLRCFPVRIRIYISTPLATYSSDSRR
jgi:hypothetical protein